MSQNGVARNEVAQVSNVSDCAGRNNHGEFLCLSRLMGSVIKS